MIESGWYTCERNDSEKTWNTLIYMVSSPFSGLNSLHRQIDESWPMLSCASTTIRGPEYRNVKGRFHKELERQLAGKEVQHKYTLVIPRAFAHK